jgi:hypothetical protein
MPAKHSLWPRHRQARSPLKQPRPYGQAESCCSIDPTRLHATFFDKRDLPAQDQVLRGHGPVWLEKQGREPTYVGQQPQKQSNQQNHGIMMPQCPGLFATSRTPCLEYMRSTVKLVPVIAQSVASAIIGKTQTANAAMKVVSRAMDLENEFIPISRLGSSYVSNPHFSARALKVINSNDGDMRPSPFVQRRPKLPVSLLAGWPEAADRSLRIRHQSRATHSFPSRCTAMAG